MRSPTDSRGHWSTWFAEGDLELYIATAQREFAHCIETAKGAEDQRQQARSFLNTTRLCKLTHNRAAIWELALARLETQKPWSVQVTVNSFALLVRYMDQPFERNQEYLEDYLDSRTPGRGERPEDWNGRTKPGTDEGYGREERPRKGMRALQKLLQRSFEILRAKGRDVQLQVTVQDSPDGTPTNDRDFMLEIGPFNPKLRAEEKSFLYMHLIGMDIQAIRHCRLSWLTRIFGAPAIVTPGGAVAWLGPYYNAIFGQAWRRRDDASPGDKDPLLHPHMSKEGKEVVHYNGSHARLVRKIMRRTDVCPELVIRTGRAGLLAIGASVHYLMQASSLTGDWTMGDFEALEKRVAIYRALGKFAPQLEKNTRPVPPGKQVCTVCQKLQDTDKKRCEDCGSPMDTNTWGTAQQQARWTMHRLLDDILLVRGDTEASREELHYQIMQAGGTPV